MLSYPVSTIWVCGFFLSLLIHVQSKKLFSGFELTDNLLNVTDFYGSYKHPRPPFRKLWRTLDLFVKSPFVYTIYPSELDHDVIEARVVPLDQTFYLVLPNPPNFQSWSRHDDEHLYQKYTTQRSWSLNHTLVKFRSFAPSLTLISSFYVADTRTNDAPPLPSSMNNFTVWEIRSDQEGSINSLQLRSFLYNRSIAITLETASYTVIRPRSPTSLVSPQLVPSWRTRFSPKAYAFMLEPPSATYARSAMQCNTSVLQMPFVCLNISQHHRNFSWELPIDSVISLCLPDDLRQARVFWHVLQMSTTNHDGEMVKNDSLTLSAPSVLLLSQNEPIDRCYVGEDTSILRPRASHIDAGYQIWRFVGIAEGHNVLKLTFRKKPDDSDWYPSDWEQSWYEHYHTEADVEIHLSFFNPTKRRWARSLGM